jgi:hypothetical protein
VSDATPAPGLREVAEVWWDVDRDPVLVWSKDGGTLWLADPSDPDQRLLIGRFAAAPADPERVAAALADGLAACDFPPTGEAADPDHVQRALDAAGVGERVVQV